MFWLNLFFCLIAIICWTGLIIWQFKKPLHGWFLTNFYKPPKLPKEQELNFTHIFPKHTQKSSSEDKSHESD